MGLRFAPVVTDGDCGTRHHGLRQHWVSSRGCSSCLAEGSTRAGTSPSRGAAPQSSILDALCCGRPLFPSRWICFAFSKLGLCVSCSFFLTSLISLVFANPPSSASSEGFVHVLFPPSSTAFPEPSKHSGSRRATTGPVLSIFPHSQSSENPQRKPQTFPQQIQVRELHTSAGHSWEPQPQPQPQPGAAHSTLTLLFLTSPCLGCSPRVRAGKLAAITGWRCKPSLLHPEQSCCQRLGAFDNSPANAITRAQ